jgi:hypothetical protein
VLRSEVLEGDDDFGIGRDIRNAGTKPAQNPIFVTKESSDQACTRKWTRIRRVSSHMRSTAMEVAFPSPTH